MTPDAAGIVAQVDVGLLIALAVDARPSRDKTEDRHNLRTADGNSKNQLGSKYAFIHAVGILGTFISLEVALSSVVYNKTLQGAAMYIAINTLFLGVVPLLTSAIDRLMSQVKELTNVLAFYVVMLFALLWFIIWYSFYIPGGLFSW
jgi:hypothetical protein